RVFRSYVEELGEVRTVSLLRDVDEVCDLFSLRDTLAVLDETLPEQRELIDFLDTVSAYTKSAREFDSNGFF
ncbi:MAG: hypothetical protein ACU84J_12905, partial [Gammaproteobacteria bacterium]